VKDVWQPHLTISLDGLSPVASQHTALCGKEQKMWPRNSSSLPSCASGETTQIERGEVSTLL